jgi:hypothetical protein
LQDLLAVNPQLPLHNSLTFSSMVLCQDQILGQCLSWTMKPVHHPHIFYSFQECNWLYTQNFRRVLHNSHSCKPNVLYDSLEYMQSGMRNWIIPAWYYQYYTMVLSWLGTAISKKTLTSYCLCMRGLGSITAMYSVKAQACTKRFLVSRSCEHEYRNS